MADPKRVFLCYSREDRDSARALFERLEAAGFEPWMDRPPEKDGGSIPPGEFWPKEIRARIREADYFIALFSSASRGRQSYAQVELKQALALLGRRKDGGFLIPVCLDDCPLPNVEVGAVSLSRLHAIGPPNALDRVVHSLTESRSGNAPLDIVEANRDWLVLAFGVALGLSLSTGDSGPDGARTREAARARGVAWGVRLFVPPGQWWAGVLEVRSRRGANVVTLTPLACVIFYVLSRAHGADRESGRAQDLQGFRSAAAISSERKELTQSAWTRPRFGSRSPGSVRSFTRRSRPSASRLRR